MMKSILPAVLVALTLSACVKEEMVPRGTSGGVGPTLVVEQFMRALNSEPKDLGAMGRLFGTKDGPVSERDPRPQVEQRMFTIATVLRHDDFEIVREQQVPGRSTEATQLLVKITSNRNSSTVPFTMVRYKDGGWLIEQIGLDAVTIRR